MGLSQRNQAIGHQKQSNTHEGRQGTLESREVMLRMGSLVPVLPQHLFDRNLSVESLRNSLEQRLNAGRIGKIPLTGTLFQV